MRDPYPSEGARHKAGRPPGDRIRPRRRGEPFGNEPFPDDLVTAKTRLGQEDYRSLLPAPVAAPYTVVAADTPEGITWIALL